jgi:hypothetical protein
MSKKLDLEYLELINNFEKENVLQKFGKWTQNIDELKKGFSSALPFEHVVIDDFLCDEYAEEIYKSFPQNYINFI